VEGKITRLFQQRDAIDREIADLRRERPPADWAVALMAILPEYLWDGECLRLDRKADLYGAPRELWAQADYISLEPARSGPGLIRVLRAILELEEAREEERQKGE